MSGCAVARSRVCGVCTRKGPNLRNISDAVLIFIQDYHYKDYNKDDFPNVICGSCDYVLRCMDKLEEGEVPTRRLPDITDYEGTEANQVHRRR